MPYRTLRRTTIATAVALAAGLASAPAASATTPIPSTMTIGNVKIDEYGPAGDLDVTVTSPTAADAYIVLALNATHLDQLTITDDTGTVLPVTVPTGNSGPVPPGVALSGTVDLGAADSDDNGISGAPLAAGTIHLHVAAGYPAPSPVAINGTVIDGASGSIIGRSGVGHNGTITVGGPSLTTGWDVPGQEPVPSNVPVGVPTGGLVISANLFTQMSMQAPPAATHTRWTIPADQIRAAGYTPAQLAAALHVDYAPTTGGYTARHWTTTADGSLVIDLPAYAWPGGPAPAAISESLHVAVDWGLSAGTLNSVFETLAANGTPYAEWDQLLHFTTDTVPAAHRATLYGRDSTGVLWQHQATPFASRPGTFSPRTLVGGGWGVYNTITALGPLKANGTGDLVTRDSSGVLWYHRGTGNNKAPFASRTRISGGWQIYNQIASAGDVTGEGHPDLVARDNAGVLWLYRGTGNPAAPLANRTRICAGWQGYNLILSAGDIDGDGHSDLLARDTAGVLWYYPGTGKAAAPYANRVRIGGGWQGYTSIVGIGDMTGKGHQDLVARDATGMFWYYRGTGNPAAPYATRALSGGGMNIYNTLL